MSTNSNSSKSGGVGLTGFLFLIFLTLKLTGYIDWSWWWITAPLWIPVLLVLLIFSIILLMGNKK
jgi:hypothetical protein